MARHRYLIAGTHCKENPMRRWLLLLVPVIALAAAAYHYRYQWLPKAAYDGQPNRYQVVLDDAAGVVRVQASIWVDSSYLSLFDVQPIPGLPEGHAGLLQDLQVSTVDGDALDPPYLGVGDYQVRPGQRLQLNYSIRLAHDDYRWPAGKEEVAYRTADGWLFKLSTLLMADGGPAMQGPFEIRFELPAGWQAYTPWQAGEAPLSFVAASRRELLNNVAFFGRAHAETIRAGGVDIQLVLGRRYVPAVESFRELLQRQAESYARLFGGQPANRRFLVVINEDRSGDGGAFSHSFSQLIDGDADIAGRVVWGHTMAHELLHFWNGLSMVPADEREEWFKEGVTDYLTIQTMAQNGFIDQALVFERLETHQQRQLLARMLQQLDMSVREAGRNKQPNRLLVYGGGAIAALRIDAELRQRSGDRLGLNDLIAALYAEFQQPDQRYTLDDVRRIAKDKLGVAIDELLDSTVESTSVIDPTPALAAFGLRMHQFAEEIYLSHDPKADAQTQARFAAAFVPTAMPAAMAGDAAP